MRRTLCLALVFVPTLTLSAIHRVPSEFPTIQTGIDACAEGDTVVVSPGTYYEHGIEIRKRLTLRGEFGDPAAVVVDAHQLDRVLGGYGAYIRIKGLTFRNGLSTAGSGLYIGGGGAVYDCVFIDNESEQGGAVAAFGDGYYGNHSAYFENCRFESNGAEIGGGVAGVFMRWLRFKNCEFVGNHSSREGGGFFGDGVGLTMTGCTFTDNSSEGRGGGLHVRECWETTVSNCSFTQNSATDGGGGMSWRFGSKTLNDCLIVGNTADIGGGIMCGERCYATFTRCTISGNTAGSGGGVYSGSDSSPNFHYCTFVDNVAESGEGLGGALAAGPGSGADLWNCTIARNSATGAGAGIALSEGSALSIERSMIVFSSKGEALHCEGLSSITMSCTNIHANAGGDFVGCIEGMGFGSNFSTDPQFCSTPSGSIYLAWGSPCLPGNHPHGESCELIGAWGADSDCDGTTATAETSWSAVKSMY